MSSKLICRLCLVIMLVSITRCTVNNKVTLIYKGSCEQNQQIKVTIDNLLNDPSQYDSKEIEITGIYKWGSEESAIYRTRSSSRSNSLWINFGEINSLIEEKSGKALLGSKQEHDKIINKKVTIRGLFDPSYKGHLDKYPGAIINICYVKVFE